MNPFTLQHPEDRRTFIEHCAKTALGVSLMPWLNSTAGAAAAGSAAGRPGFGKAQRVIVLFLDGGLSHIDSFDPKTGPSKGPGDAISTKADFQVTSFFPETAKVAQKITVVRSMAAKVGVHASAQYLMRTGYEKRGTIIHPTLGAWAQHFLGASSQNLPSSVCVNQNANHGNGFFPATYSPLPILEPEAGLSNVRSLATPNITQKRLNLLAELNAAYTKKANDGNVRAYNEFYDSTLGLMKSEDLKAFDLAPEPAELRDRYGRNRFGQGCLLARRLVENGVRFVEVHSGGWDMHKDLQDSMEDRGGELDKAFAALVSDLDSRGLLESTLVVVATEFGRKPDFDGSGRGHHPIAFCSVLAGGGVKRGYVHGSTDALGKNPASDAMSPGDLHATVAWAAGLPLQTEVQSPSGRPMSIGNKGKPALALFA
jgi:hypothetical protein